jgi:Zn-dependent M28 family amino/carboxypeptidase
MNTADPAQLAAHVRALEGERHPVTSPAALRAAADYIVASLRALGLPAELRPFQFRGQSFDNVVAVQTGTDAARPRVLIGAHYDSVRGTPGADDNASGVAGLLEAARLLAARPVKATIEFVGFNLEELQTYTYRVGSRRYAAAARANGVRYAGTLVLEMLGYFSREANSQYVPKLLFWKRVPRTGSFIAATGDRRSKALLKTFAQATESIAPDLELVTFRSPFRGWLVPHTRLSDNASFWDEGYPSLMVTDTAFLRNPHYHRRSDSAQTLDYESMARVVNAVVETAVRLAT